MSKINRFIYIVISLMVLVACSKEEKAIVEEKTIETEKFDLQNHFIGGFLGTGSGKNIFVIRFLDKNKAVFSQNYVDLVAKYTFVEKKNLIVEVKDDANYRVMKFDLNENNEIIYGYYQALSSVSPIDASLVKIAVSNEFAGNTFKGTENYYVGSNPIVRPNWFYKFDEKGRKYGTDSDIATLSFTNRVEQINNSAFKYYESSSDSAIGFIGNDGILYVYGKDGASTYLGNYKKQ